MWGRGQESLTQAVGRAAYDSGVQALLAPSAQSRTGRNLVLFPELVPSGALNLLNPIKP